ncbi:MAG: hypothetical protein L3I91_01810 [Mycoplasma sp.]
MQKKKLIGGIVATSVLVPAAVAINSETTLKNKLNEIEESDGEEEFDDGSDNSSGNNISDAPDVPSDNSLSLTQTINNNEFEDINVEHVIIESISLENILVNNTHPNNYNNLTFKLFLNENEITNNANEYGLSFNSTNGELKTLVGREINKLDNLSIQVYHQTYNLSASTNKFSVSVKALVKQEIVNETNPFPWAIVLGSAFGGIVLIGLIAFAFFKRQEKDKENKK